MTSGPGEQLEQRLRRWTANHDPHVRAAVDLLIAHNSWLRRRRFVEIATPSDQETGDAWIIWQDARQAFDAGAFLPASSTELAVLDLAIALGEDRYLLSRMGDANSRDIATAVCPPRAAGPGHRGPVLPALRRRLRGASGRDGQPGMSRARTPRPRPPRTGDHQGVESECA